MSKIKIIHMEFSNILSYGESNRVDFCTNSVTQLVGPNGAGKSSLATILEEGLYNKNSRGIKKDALFNWNSDTKAYKIDIVFIKDEDTFTVSKEVKSTSKVRLDKNGIDISGHTATQTYKLIEDIIGCDFSTFTKLVYQSIGSSLDFLRATDANRKVFLTGLFSHEIYKETSEDLKKDAKQIKSDLEFAKGKLDALSSVMKKYEGMDLTAKQEKVEVPELEEQPIQDLITEAKVSAALAKDNKTKITKLSGLDRNVQAAQKAFDQLARSMPKAPTDVFEELQRVTRDLSIVTSEASKVKLRYQGFKKQSEVCDCPTCGKPIDVSDAITAAALAKEEYQPLFDKRTELENRSQELNNTHKEYTKYNLAVTALRNAQAELESFKEGIEIPSLDLDTDTIIKESEALVTKLNKDISNMRSKIRLAQEFNNLVDVENAKLTSIAEQLVTTKDELATVSKKVNELSAELYDLEVLSGAFKDLVAYKLEHSVKVFEELINSYLSVLTEGKFALGFELDTTKLIVVIFNDGVKTSIESCSTGQQHRIQLATLLAIRSLMSAISKVSINLLFLDEVISFIDTQGINTLVELLVGEHELNSFLVSHGHYHPLAKVISVEQDPKGNSRLK